MKKLSILLLTGITTMSILSACQTTAPIESESTESTTTTNEETVVETSEMTTTDTSAAIDIDVMSMNGATTMGLVKFISDSEAGLIESNQYNFQIAKVIDEVLPLITKGEIDLATVPANVASVLYNSTEGDISVLAINTLGVLYLVEHGVSIEDISDLEGKTIYAAGKGATPEAALNYILEANGLTDKVTIEWKSEQAEVVAALATTEGAIGMLPEPFVSTARKQNENLNVVLDLTKEWDATDSEGSLVTGVVVGYREFLEANPDAVEDFLAHYEASVNYVNENLEEAAALVGHYGITPEDVALEALPACNITFIQGEELETTLSGYLNVLFEQNPASIGGALPLEDFYYESE